MNLNEALARVIGGEDLTLDEAAEVMEALADGKFSPETLGGFLVAMQMKGATGQELAGMAQVLRSRARKVKVESIELVDTCGTGGGRASFNLSTAAAIVAAASGVPIAKHGNRSVTSKCGSADVLEALGIPFLSEVDDISEPMREFGLVFLFAPQHHPSLREVGSVRKSLGIRTIFNQLGPLANPAGASRQLVGVYDLKLLQPMAQALILLGCQRGFIVHSSDDMDEASPCGTTHAIRIWNGELETLSFEPGDFGIDEFEESDLLPGITVEENASILMDAISGSNLGRMEALIPDVSLVLMLAGLASNSKEASEMARSTIQKGSAIELVRKMQGRND